jgi:hypothetical protein
MGHYSDSYEFDEKNRRNNMTDRPCDTEPPEPTANDRQVGGDHYKAADGVLQHWDLIALYGIGYLEGNATKYVSRWRKKNGRVDLEKSLHYVDKMIELAQAGKLRPSGIVPITVIDSFVIDHWINEREAKIIEKLLRWETVDNLGDIKGAILWLLNDTKLGGGPDPTGMKHPFGHYPEWDDAPM